MRLIIYLLISAMFLMMISSCTKEVVIDKIYPETPFNPYDTIDRSVITAPVVPVDSASFLGIHTYIFAPKCGVPACHDGAFEPDFRTVHKAYSTLVYHKPVKNDAGNTFKYRVEPNKHLSSWLFHRITTDDQVLGRMPLYDNPLNDVEVTHIKNWINSGAPDILGNPAVLPAIKPSFFGVVAYLPAVNNLRVDTFRIDNNLVYPFVVPHNSEIKLWVGMHYIGPDNYWAPGNTLKYNKIRFAVNDQYNFINSVEMNLNVDLFPFMAPAVNGAQAPYFHHVTFNTSQFSPGDIVYFRAYVTDDNNPDPIEIPSKGGPFYLKTYFSFKVQ